MATSRLFTLLLGTSIARSSSQIPPLIKFNKTRLSPSLRLKRYSSHAFSIDSDTPTLTTDDSPPVNSAAHPWPEWVSFVDRLKTNGYLTQNAPVIEKGDGEVMKLVKDACLSFARDRFDIFRSLSKQDIQTVVEKGCPNMLRKTVNSAKRLRAYAGFDEGDVCASCNLRGSCDRANILLTESEAVPRTVDVVRILLIYALDPLVISRENKPPGGELVESSARKLLSELIVLSETPIDPELPKPASVTSQRKILSVDLSDKKSTRNDQMKPGDWVCTECQFMNFARNKQCRQCKADGPNRESFVKVERKKGDWDCPVCSVMNFASNRECFRCRQPRPQRELKPGDWECPDCDFVNFSRNTVCRKCNHNRPAVQYDLRTSRESY